MAVPGRSRQRPAALSGVPGGYFQQVDEELGSSLRSALQSRGLPALDKALTALLNQIALRVDPLILVLDDVHLLTETAILEGLEFLLQHQPPQLHLVLTSSESCDRRSHAIR
jgi:LuxR family maltose regulon positive regulatory protein